MQTCDWTPTPSAPEAYPAHLIKGDFQCDGLGDVEIPGGRTIRNGWGRPGPIHLVGDEQKPAPHQMRLAWFSYADDRFYSGVFDLPRDRFADLFANPPTDPASGAPDPWSRVIVGMAPGGGVSVWLSCPSATVEVVAFRAAEVDLDFAEVDPRGEEARADVVASVMASVAEAPNPATGDWVNWRRRTTWTAEVGAPDAQLEIRMANGERESTRVAAKNDAAPDALRAAPLSMILSWAEPGGHRRGATVDLDHEEVIEIFGRISNGDRTAPLRLRIDPDEDGDLTLTIAGQMFAQRLRKTRRATWG